MKTSSSISILIACIILLGACKKATCPSPDATIGNSNGTTSEVRPLNNWQLKTSGLTGNLFCTDFLTKNIGYITGMDGVAYKTIDGGESYQALSVFATPYDSYTMDFIDENTGIIGANDGASNTIIKKTTDGGQTWTDLSIPGAIWRLVKFVNSSLVFAGGGQLNDTYGYGVIFRSTDGGANWTQINIPGLLTPRCLIFVNATTGFLGTTGGKIYKTIDTGQSWTLLNHNISTALPEIQVLTGVIYFKNEMEGFSFTNTPFFNDGFFMRTNDGGATWAPQAYPASGLSTYNVYYGMHFISDKIGYMSGGNLTDNLPSLLKTIDGGDTWVEETLPAATGLLRWMSFGDSETCYIMAGNSGVVKGNIQ